MRTFVARIIANVLAVLTGIIVAKWLGPDGKGIYSGVQILLALPIAVMAGVGASITYLMTKSRYEIGELVPALSVIFTVLSALAWLVVLAWGFVHGWTIAPIAVAVVVPAAIVLSWQQSFYIATGELQRLNLQTIALAALILIAVGMAVVPMSLGTPGAVGAWVLCNYVVAIAVVVDVLRRGGWWHRDDLRARIKRITRFGMQSGLNTSLGVLNYRMDSLILAGMLGFASFGIYSIAVNVGELAFSITRPISTAVARQIGVAEKDRAAQITAQTIRISTAIIAAIGVISFVFGPWLIELVYGPRFAPAAIPLRLLVPGIVAYATAGIFSSYFMFQMGKPSIVTQVNMLMLATQFVGCMLLVPRFGLGGAAIGSSGTYLVGALINTIAFVRATGLSPAAVWILRREDLRLMLPRRGFKEPQPVYATETPG
jgi:O-antigen/teichoic acid export membrane protein